MLKLCAENNEILRVSKFYALLHKNKRFISQQVCNFNSLIVLFYSYKFSCFFPDMYCIATTYLGFGNCNSHVHSSEKGS